MGSVLKAFNSHLEEFIRDVSLVFPNDLDIRVAKTTISTLIKLNPSKLIKVWKKHICKYSEEISSGNIEYFLNKDYSEDIGGMEDADNISNVINKLRNPVREMGGENQAKAIKYIQNLNKLCLVYFN